MTRFALFRDDGTGVVDDGNGNTVDFGSVNGISDATLVAGSNVTITDNSPTAGSITIAASGGGGGGGAEIGYSEITSNASVTDTSESTATALITTGSMSFDGSPVMVEVFGVVQLDTAAVGDALTICLFEGSTEITRLWAERAAMTSPADIHTMYARYRFTPSAGSHTYKVTGYVPSTSGTPKIIAGTGGTAGSPPAFIRFTYA